jgi:hypothetical protein
MKEVFKCRDWRMMRWDEEWIKAQAWGCPYNPKKYPRGTSVKAWGSPRGTPFFMDKNQVTFYTLYFYCFMHYAFFLERQLLLLLVFIFCFACWNKWLDHIMLVWRETYSIFHCQEHSSFHSYSSTSNLFFCYCV